MIRVTNFAHKNINNECRKIFIKSELDIVLCLHCHNDCHVIVHATMVLAGLAFLLHLLGQSHGFDVKCWQR